MNTGRALSVSTLLVQPSLMSEHQLTQLGSNPKAPFPDPETHTRADGLLAWGGDLSCERLLQAYRSGVFPWYEPGGPILWWSPDPRMIFELATFKTSRRLGRTIKATDWTVSVDQAFDEVIRACAEPRRDQTGTWITPEMISAYAHLHRAGWAHSLEVWEGSQLLGGIYGVAVGRTFCAESKFHRKTHASKVALVALIKLLNHWSFDVLDCQVPNDHLVRLGANAIPRHQFLERLKHGLARPTSHPSHHPGLWSVNGHELQRLVKSTDA